MDFFIFGPVLIVTGLILVHLALRSEREAQTPSERGQNLTRPLTMSPSRYAARQPATPAVEQRLADALSELSNAREEVQQLRAKLEALQKPPARASKPQTRRPARTSPQGA